MVVGKARADPGEGRRGDRGTGPEHPERHRPSDFGQDPVGDPRFPSGCLGPGALLPSLRSVSWGKHTLVLAGGAGKGSLLLHCLPRGHSLT